VLALLLLVPSAPELGLSVLGILAFGDGTATLVGLVVGGRRLPWNPAKSWAGLIAFVSASIPISALIYCGEAQPRIGYDQALACVAPAAMLAALAESIPSRINDNIRVGLAGAVTILITHAMFVGC
jgi:dolichol kinase